MFLVTIVIKFREGVEVAKYTETDRKPNMEKNVVNCFMVFMQSNSFFCDMLESEMEVGLGRNAE